ncbi:hypothetical protein [Prochlorothrix hollandica]|nr:hypothetical protein [Prochlorothrix hollandica]
MVPKCCGAKLVPKVAVTLGSGSPVLGDRRFIKPHFAAIVQ